jgi:hypothetical protein
MRLLLVISLIAAVAGCSHAPLLLPDNHLIGLWQFPERRVWVQIDADGSAFQCRIAQGGTAITARGRFLPSGSILWQEIWGTDRLIANPDSIVLHGQFGDFTYVRATAPLDSACLLPGEA